MGHAQQLEKYYKQLNKKKQSQKASNKYMNSLTPILLTSLCVFS